MRKVVHAILDVIVLVVLSLVFVLSARCIVDKFVTIELGERSAVSGQLWRRGRRLRRPTCATRCSMRSEGPSGE